LRHLEEFGYNDASSKPNHPWGQIFISIAAVIVTLIGAKIEGFEWAIYIAVPVLIAAFVLMLSDTAMASQLRNKISNYKDRKIISKCSEEYLHFFKKIKVIKDISETISNMEWGEIKSPRYSFPSNRLSDLSIIINDKCHPKLSKAVFLNQALNVLVDEADRFIQESDYLVVQRKVTYKYEHEKSKLLKLIRKYDEFREQHDDFCSNINEKTSKVFLRQFYDHTFSFMPKEISQVNESQV
jgi:hypothetical protein